jgi:hypothetical protein
MLDIAVPPASKVGFGTSYKSQARAGILTSGWTTNTRRNTTAVEPQETPRASQMVTESISGAVFSF